MSNSKEDVNSYSPSGRLYQIEYAYNAMNLDTPTLAISNNDAVVFISECKRKFKFYEQEPKHLKIFDGIARSFSGNRGDARRIAEVARELCLGHSKIFNEAPTIDGLLRRMSHIAMKFSEKDSAKKLISRPFGAAIMFARIGERPEILSFEPSGAYRGWRGVCFGNGCESVNTSISKEYDAGLGEESTDTLISKGLEMLGRVMEDKQSPQNVEISIVSREGIKDLTPAEIDEYIKRQV